MFFFQETESVNKVGERESGNVFKVQTGGIAQSPRRNEEKVKVLIALSDPGTPLVPPTATMPPYQRYLPKKGTAALYQASGLEWIPRFP